MIPSNHLTNPSIKVDSVWSSSEREFFLNTCQINIQIRNISNQQVRIDRVNCIFQTDEGVDPFIPSCCPDIFLKVGEVSEPIPIMCTVDLGFTPYTNRYRLEVFYSLGVKQERLLHESEKYMLFSRLGDCDKSFFISHKDPEDTTVCKKLASFLEKLGFKGYLAEEKTRPGVEFWKTKIPNAIKASIGVIVYWTSRARRNPDSIKREIRIARSVGKTIILLREKGVGMPKGISKKQEFFRFNGTVSDLELKSLAAGIYATYREGGYPNDRPAA